MQQCFQLGRLFFLALRDRVGYGVHNGPNWVKLVVLLVEGGQHGADFIQRAIMQGGQLHDI